MYVVPWPGSRMTGNTQPAFLRPVVVGGRRLVDLTGFEPVTSGDNSDEVTITPTGPCGAHKTKHLDRRSD